MVVFHADKYDKVNSHFSQFLKLPKNTTADTTILPPVASS